MYIYLSIHSLQHLSIHSCQIVLYPTALPSPSLNLFFAIFDDDVNNVSSLIFMQKLPESS